MCKKKNKNVLRNNVTNNDAVTEEDKRKNDVLILLSEQKFKIKACQIWLSVVTCFMVVATATIVYLMLAIVPDSKWRINGLIVFWLLFFLMLFAINCVIKRISRYNKAKRKIESLETRLKLDSDNDLITSYRLERELKMIYQILES